MQAREVRAIFSNNGIILVGEFDRKIMIISLTSVLDYSLEFTEEAATKKQAELQRRTELYRFVLETLGSSFQKHSVLLTTNP